MGACYGTGVRGHLAYDLFPSEEDELKFMLEFAGLGLSTGFRDVIGGRVAEFLHSKSDGVQMRWLEPEEAAPILEQPTGGSAPYSLLEAFWSDDMLFIPGFRGSRGWSLDRLEETHPLYNYPVAPLRNALRIARDGVEHYEAQEEDTQREVDFLKELLIDFDFCTKHKLLYCFGY